MPVIQSSVLPYQPTTRDKLMDALIAAAPQIALAIATKGVSLLGQVPTKPTSRNPGTFNFPAGSQSPLEAAQIQQLGGVPTNAGVMAKATQFPRAGGISYQPPTKLGIRPDLVYPTAQADLELKQNQAGYWKTVTDMARTPPPTTPPAPQPPKPPVLPQLTSPVLQGLWSKAQTGDAKAMDALRLLAIERDDPEAIAILQSLGEL